MDTQPQSLAEKLAALRAAHQSVNQSPVSEGNFPPFPPEKLLYLFSISPNTLALEYFAGFKLLTEWLMEREAGVKMIRGRPIPDIFTSYTLSQVAIIAGIPIAEAYRIFKELYHE